MNIVPVHTVLAMSSAEIAQLTGKRHGDVIRDIRAMLDALGDDADLRHVRETKDGRGYTSEFSLAKDLTLTLVAGYDVRLRKRIIDRWQSLEDAARGAVQVPTTLAGALRMAADQAEELERARPAVEFVERYVAAPTGSLTFRQVAKLMRANENDLRAFLTDNDIMYRLNGTMTPRSNHIDAGRFETRSGVAPNEHAYTRALFTPKGVQWIAGLWIAEQARTPA